MTGFNTKAKNDNGEYEVKFYTDDRDKYKAVEEFFRKMIGHSKVTKDSIRKGEDADKLIEALNIAEAAIEKQIPKQPKIDRITYVGGQGYFDELYCPVCNNLLIQRDDSGVYFAGGRNRFCEVCGQKLAWGNEK